MGLFEDLHLLICLIAFIYLFRKVRDATQSRVLGVTVSAFIIYFIFFQHVMIAFLFFFVMFGYLFVGGFTSGVIEGQMTGAYMSYMKNPKSMWPYPSWGTPAPPTLGGGTGSWFGK